MPTHSTQSEPPKRPTRPDQHQSPSKGAAASSTTSKDVVGVSTAADTSTSGSTGTSKSTSIEALADTSTGAPASTATGTQTTQDPIIAIEGVTKRYPHAKSEALRGMTLSIAPQEFFGLLGPNGCGKTTLISILCGLLSATSGKILIHGRSLHQALKAIKHSLGYVPQELALYPTLTVTENLRFFGRLYGLSGKRLKSQVAKCLKVAQLEEAADRQVIKYSGGMMRRANLVAGLIHEPKILFLDEPTVNVDPQSREVIFDILRELNRHGTTIIYTTHYLEEAQQLCHRVAIVDQGQVVDINTPTKLVQQHGCRDLGEVFLKLTGRALRD